MRNFCGGASTLRELEKDELKMKNYWRYARAALVPLGLIVAVLLWPSTAPSEHLKGVTKHLTIRQSTDVPWADYKVELWNSRTDKYTLWTIKVTAEGTCHMKELGDGAVQRGS